MSYQADRKAEAAEAIEAGIFVKLNAAGKAVACDTQGEAVYGVAGRKVAIGDMLPIYGPGQRCLLKVGGAIALNASRQVMTTADGDAIAFVAAGANRLAAEIDADVKLGATSDGDDVWATVAFNPNF